MSIFDRFLSRVFSYTKISCHKLSLFAIISMKKILFFPGTAYVEDRLHSNYSAGDVIVHICGLNVGYGSVSQRCLSNGSWSAPDRQCNQPPVLGGGTAVGISFATLNIFFVLTVLLRHWFNPALEPEGSGRDHPI